MKKVSVCFLGGLINVLSFPSLAAHKIIPNYSELLKTLKEGNSVRAVMALNKCNPSASEYATEDDILWSIDFNNFYKAKFPHEGQLAEGIAVAYYKLKQTDNGLIYDYARIRIFTDNTVEGYSEFINPKDLSSLKKTYYHCSLAKDVVTLYDRG